MIPDVRDVAGLIFFYSDPEGPELESQQANSEFKAMEGKIYQAHRPEWPWKWLKRSKVARSSTP